MIRYVSIKKAHFHNIAGLDKSDIRGIKAKKEKSRSMVTGRNMPGVLLRLDYIGRDSLMWIDLNMAKTYKIIAEDVTGEVVEQLINEGNDEIAVDKKIKIIIK